MNNNVWKQNTQMESHVLESIKTRMQYKLGPHITQNLKVEIIEQLYDEISLNIETSVLGQKGKKKFAVKFKQPLNWWEHFKLDKLPTWIKNIFPVKYKTETKEFEFDCTVLFPYHKFVGGGDKVVVHEIKPLSNKVWEVK